MSSSSIINHYRYQFDQHRAHVIVYCSVFWSLGLCVAFLGPTIWDLGCATGTIIPTMAYLFFVQSLFMLFGSAIAGLIITRLSNDYVLLIGMIGIDATLLLISISGNVYALGIVLSLMGFAMGLIDTTANVSMMTLFGDDVSPFLQALHFFYGFGAFASPIIVEPFISNFDCTPLIVDNATALTSSIEQSISEMQHDSSIQIPKTLHIAQQELRVNRAFIIMALLQIPIIIGIVVLIMRRRNTEQLNKMQHNRPPIDDKCGGGTDYENIDNYSPSTTTTNLPLSFDRRILLLSCLLLFCADGIQATYGDYIFSYSKLTIRALSLVDAAGINATFWGAFAFGRLLAIGFALYLSSYCLLLIDVIGIMIAMMLILAHTMLDTVYIGTFLFGLFLSSIYPSVLCSAKQLINIGPQSTSILVVAAAMGEMFYPVIIGKWMDSIGPQMMPIWLLTSIAIMIVIVGILLSIRISRIDTTTPLTRHQLIHMLVPAAFNNRDDLKMTTNTQINTSTINYQEFTNDANDHSP